MSPGPPNAMERPTAALGRYRIERELGAGALPFTGTYQQVVMAKMAKDPPSLADRAPAAPPALARLVARCLARDPVQRPATRRPGSR